MSGASAWKHVTSSRVREIREDVVFEGKKIHFQDSLSLGWRVTRVGVRDRDGSGEARTRIERSGGGNSFCPSRQKNYTRFFKIMRNFLTKPFSLSLIVTIILVIITLSIVTRLFFFFSSRNHRASNQQIAFQL